MMKTRFAAVRFSLSVPISIPEIMIVQISGKIVGSLNSEHSPESARSRSHDENWNPRSIGELIENILSTFERTRSIYPLKWYRLYFKMPLN